MYLLLLKKKKKKEHVSFVTCGWLTIYYAWLILTLFFILEGKKKKRDLVKYVFDFYEPLGLNA